MIEWVNPNNTSVADFDNYPGDKHPSSPREYDNEDRESYFITVVQLLTIRRYVGDLNDNDYLLNMMILFPL